MEIKTFEEFMLEDIKLKKILLCEHKIYKNINGTKKSYREDSENTNSNTQKHVHVYAKRNGNGKELYSVNIDGTGHDGSRGKEISKKEADFFRDKGYKINLNNLLESIDFEQMTLENYQFIIIEY